jgi:hypothetical protein
MTEMPKPVSRFTDRGPVRLLVTGSRTWTDRQAINDCLSLAQEYWASEQGIVIIHGKCPEGADLMAHEWAVANGVEEEPHPANWKVGGRSAGMTRNSEMVALGADMCIAFIKPCSGTKCKRRDKHGSHGSSHCASEARHAGIPVWFVREEE